MFKFNFSNDEQHDDDDKSDIINVQETTSIIESGLDGIQLEDGQPEKGRVLLEAKEIHSSSSSTTTTTTTSEGDLYVIAETCILIPNSLILFKRMVSDVKFAIAQQDDDDDEGLDVERLDVPITTTTTTAITECHYDRNDTKALARTLLENTDLIGGVYEGGLKTWECSLDLVRHLHTHSIIPTITTTTSSSSSTLLTSHHLRVLELGCGSALPGIYCLTRGSGILVDFQDYNEEVLRLITIPNVLLNTTSSPNHPHHPTYNPECPDQHADMDSDECFETCIKTSTTTIVSPMMTGAARFFSGDWGSSTLIPALLSNNNNNNNNNDTIDYKSDTVSSSERIYDIILTSETLYEASSIPRLLNLVTRVLKKPEGMVYVASKTNYFGCSGSLQVLKDELEKRKVGVMEDDYHLHMTTEQVFGTQCVRREIVKLSWMKTASTS